MAGKKHQIDGWVHLLGSVAGYRGGMTRPRIWEIYAAMHLIADGTWGWHDRIVWLAYVATRHKVRHYANQVAPNRVVDPNDVCRMLGSWGVVDPPTREEVYRAIPRVRVDVALAKQRLPLWQRSGRRKGKAAIPIYGIRSLIAPVDQRKPKSAEMIVCLQLCASRLGLYCWLNHQDVADRFGLSAEIVMLAISQMIQSGVLRAKDYKPTRTRLIWSCASVFFRTYQSDYHRHTKILIDGNWLPIRDYYRSLRPIPRPPPVRIL